MVLTLENVASVNITDTAVELATSLKQLIAYSKGPTVHGEEVYMTVQTFARTRLDKCDQHTRAMVLDLIMPDLKQLTKKEDSRLRLDQDTLIELQKMITG